MGAETGQMLSHYRLVEKIGEGGMGVVWRAEDTILHRTVALKVLPTDLALDERRRRMFLNEARLAASVSHAHIVQVHELGSDAGLDFIVMEYVDGRPLSWMLRGRPLPPDRVAELGLQIARGLGRAHHEGLIHRDLKPGNIMVTSESEVKIVDFGLAMLHEANDRSIDSRASTVTDVLPSRRKSSVVGTVPYMSPEQVRGDKLDPRSDIFSLGSVLYELTTGRRPFLGSRPSEVASAILNGRPTPVHELVPKVPLDLDRIIEKAMAPRPAERYQIVDDLAVDLRRLAKELESGSSPSYDDLKPTGTGRRMRWALAVLAVLVFVALWLGGRSLWPRLATPGAGRERTVLILPMEVRGQTDGGEYAGRAFAEAMAINLAQAKEVRVLPVPAPGDLTVSGGTRWSRFLRESDVDLLLTGSLTREDQGTRATMTVVDVRRNRVVCGAEEKAVDGDLSRIAASMTGTLSRELGLARQKLYDYVRNVTWTPEMANFPGLADIVVALRLHDVPAGLAGTERLIEAFPDVYEAHLMRLVALVDATNRDPSEAASDAVQKELDVLRRIDPANPWSEFWGTATERTQAWWDRLMARDDLTSACRAHFARQRGVNQMSRDTTEAGRALGLAYVEQSVSLDPANAFSFLYLSWALEWAGRSHEALDAARQAFQLDPTMPMIAMNYAERLAGMDRLEDALRVFKAACETGQTQTEWSAYALALRRAGRIAESVQEARIAATRPETGNGVYNLACYWAVSGNRVEAMRFLRRSLDLGSLSVQAEKDTHLVAIHRDPEYGTIMREVRKRAEAERAHRK